jgi:hypothetical protein
MHLQVQIVRFVKEYQPPIVEAQLVDSNGRRCHTFVDKVPIFTDDWPDSNSHCSHPVAIRCELLSQWWEAQGRENSRVTTEKPDAVDSTAGISRFEVLSSQLVNE